MTVSTLGKKAAITLTLASVTALGCGVTEAAAAPATGVTDIAYRTPANVSAPQDILVKGKHGYIETKYWGTVLHAHIDKHLTNLIKKGLAAAGGVSGIAAALGGGEVAAAVAAAIGAAYAAAVVCTNDKGEMNIYFVSFSLPSLPTPVCNPFA